ncbi:hypothetical protein GWN26_03235 [Candidatus Saccharibacteria bacterium]|nr:hypothetical protein [Calditrichia bacterium]NIV71586.1 hypothetical protein [Calditrichia bacterium]NIV98199.1 hypothetical protein [Candidatus Saccharibacteria bacterium]NIW78474.1 hypothetical protein [Calditrichia bacterium]
MSNCEKYKDLFVDALYDELNAKAKRRFDTHLNECSNCSREFKQLKSTLELMNQHQRSQPDEAFWEGYWDRLSEKMSRPGDKTSTTSRQGVTDNPVFQRLGRWSYQIAAAAAILLLGILIGKFFFSEPSRENQQLTNVTELTPQQALLNQRTNLYLEKSKVLLLGLVNMDSEAIQRQQVDFSSYQKVSRHLLQEASYLKPALKENKQQRLRELIGDLEVILLQIANLETDYDVSGLELIKTGVDRRAILLKINLQEIRQGNQPVPTDDGEKKKTT